MAEHHRLGEHSALERPVKAISSSGSIGLHCEQINLSFTLAMQYFAREFQHEEIPEGASIRWRFDVGQCHCLQIGRCARLRRESARAPALVALLSTWIEVPQSSIVLARLGLLGFTHEYTSADLQRDRKFTN